MEGDEEATIVLNCRVHRGWNPVKIDFVAVGFLISLIAWIVDEDGV